MKFKRLIIQLLFNFEEQYTMHAALKKMKEAADKRKEADEKEGNDFTKLWKVLYPALSNLLEIFPSPKG